METKQLPSSGMKAKLMNNPVSSKRRLGNSYIYRCALACALIAILAGFASQAQQKAPPQPVRPDGLLDRLFELKDSKTARISSADKTGGNVDWITIAPGEAKVLAEFSGVGVIRRFYVAPLASDRMRFRKLILRMYWDGEKEPSIEVPLGDFFGSGLGTLRYFHSLVVDINPGFSGLDIDGLVNYLPMPFEKGARITLENDGNVQGFILWYHIDYEQFPGGVLPAETGRLHGQWSHVISAPVRDQKLKNSTLSNVKAPNLTGEDNFVILDATGKGSYVGLFLTVDNVIGEWYGEGDDMIFVDGAKLPTFAGTGHEEVFNAGACPDVEFWGAYTGFYLIENRNGNFSGKNLMYKFYINDPVRFEKSLRVTIEHGHANNFENDYTSTAFWYQKEPHKAFPQMLSMQKRLPRWPEGVAKALEKEVRLGQELTKLVMGGRMDADAQKEMRKEMRTLVRDCNQSFRQLRFPDYIKAVSAVESLVKRLAGKKP